MKKKKTETENTFADGLAIGSASVFGALVVLIMLCFAFYECGSDRQKEGRYEYGKERYDSGYESGLSVGKVSGWTEGYKEGVTEVCTVCAE